MEKINKKCKVCGEQITGKHRSDIQYHPECKIANANAKRAIEDSGLRSLILHIRKNDRLLLKHFELSKKGKPITLDTLLRAGFSDTHYLKLTRVNSVDYVVCGRFMWTYNKEHGNVTIEKYQNN